MPKSNTAKITPGNAEKYASEVLRILQEFLFFEQNYCSFVFLGEPQSKQNASIGDVPKKDMSFSEEEKLHSKIDKINKLF